MKRHSIKDWFLATRPWSYPASVMPVVVIISYVFWLSSIGAVSGDIKWINGLLTVIAMAIFQAAGNVWSDLHDYKSGVDTEECYGVKILTSGEFSDKEIRRLAYGLLCVGIALGVVIFLLSGIWTIVFGIIGAILTVFYPWIKYNALGDVDIFLSYGVLATLGTAYVLTGTILLPALWLAIPIGLITVAILHVNNTRDVYSDANAHIRTFAMLIGHSASKAVYIAEVLVPFAIIVLLIILSQLPVWSLISLIAILPAIKNAGAMSHSSAVDMSGIVALDAATAQLQLIFSLLLSVSLIISALI